MTQRVGWLSVASWRRAGWAGIHSTTHRDGGARQRQDAAGPPARPLLGRPADLRSSTIGSALFRRMTIPSEREMAPALGLSHQEPIRQYVGALFRESPRK